MAEVIAILGKSGTGKSTSVQNLDPGSTYVFSLAGKALPFRGSSKNYTSGKGGNYAGKIDSETLCTIMQKISDTRSEIKTIIVDDAQYLQMFMVMDSAEEKGYDKFTRIAVAGYKPVKVAKELRDDLTVVFMYHPEENRDGTEKIKTAGEVLPLFI
jgi:hypothetical protein